MTKLPFFAVITFGVLLAACRSGQPSMSIEDTNLDLGDVINGDVVIRDLVVSNIGKADLVVDSVITSCGCTKATISPMTIGANESGTLHIELDSGFHGPDLTGPLIRQIFVKSNDPQQPEVKVELQVNIEARDASS